MTNDNFIGRGWAFPPLFKSPRSGPMMVAEEEEIQQALWLLVSTLVGERHLHPEFGSNLNDFMFQSGDLATLSVLKEELSNVIIEEETRIDLEEVNLDYDDIESGVLTINLQYVIRNTNTRTNLVFPFYINETIS